ncbi:Uncharacterised protein [Edwardsiella tarda]|nr:Uncharacterised protein [Edwardsiella tarda]
MKMRSAFWRSRAGAIGLGRTESGEPVKAGSQMRFVSTRASLGGMQQAEVPFDNRD